MANNFNSSIQIGIKLQPKNEVKQELQNMLNNISKEVKLNLNFDKGSLNFTTLNNELSKVKSNLKDSFNLDGITKSAYASAKSIEQEMNSLADSMGKVREQSNKRTNNDYLKNEEVQAKAINKALEDQYQQQLKLNNLKDNLQSKLNISKDNNFIDLSVINNLQNKLNSINTNTSTKEIKELQNAIKNLSNSDSQIVRLQNTISKMTTNLANMKNKFGLTIDSKATTQLQAYEQQLEKLKNTLAQLKSGKSIDGKAITNELNQMNNANRNLNTTLQSTANSMGTFSSKLQSSLSTMGIYVSMEMAVRGVFNAFKEGVSNVIDMDTALGNLNKVVGLTDSQLMQMRDSAVEMGKELGRSSIEVANAQAEFGRLYKSQSEINQMTNVSLMGANVMDNVNADQVAKSLTTIVSSMKMQAKDSMGILDSMNEIQNNYRVGANDLMEALAEVGSTAYTSGASLQKVEGYITSIAVATGESGSEVGNSLRTIMSRIYSIGRDGIEAAGLPEKTLKEVGIAVRDESGQFREFSTILDDLNSKWGSLSKTEQIAVAQKVAGVQRYNQFISLMNNYQMATDATTTALNSQGSALKENETHMQTAEAKLGVLKATLQGISFNFINSDMVKGGIDGLTKLLDTFGNMPTVVGLATASLIAFKGEAIVAGVGNLITYSNALIDLSRSYGVLKVTSTELSALMSTNPFGLIAIAIAGAVTGIVALNKYISETTDYIGKLNETSKSLQENQATQNLVTQNYELDSVIKDSSSTVEEVTSAKEKLVNIQRQLAGTFPELISGFDKEGSALVTNIDLVQKKIDANKKLALANANSDYNSLIDQISSKQMNNFYDTTSGSVWYLPSTWKSEIETYNSLLEKANQEGGKLTESEQKRLTELSTKFTDLNTAILTMKENGQDISGKKMFDGDVGGLVDAEDFIKKLQGTISSGNIDKNAKLISSAMNELKSNGVLSKEAINSLSNAFPDMEINADNAVKSLEGLNKQLKETDERKAPSSNDIAEQYQKACESVSELNGYVNTLNKEQSLTPDIISKILEKYPEFINHIGSVADAQSYLNDEISKQQDVAVDTYNQLKADDEDYYAQRFANNQDFQQAYNDFLNSFVSEGQKAYNVDTSNYKSLNDLKRATQNDFGKSIENWLRQYVGSSADGYSTDFQNFKSYAEAKASILKKLQDQIDKFENALSNNAEVAANGANDMARTEAEKLYAKNVENYNNKINTLKSAQAEIETTFDEFNGSVKQYSGGTIGTSGGSKGSGGGSKKSGKSDAEKYQEQLANLNSEIETDRYFEANNALTLLTNSMDDLKSSEEGLTGNELAESKKKEIELIYKQMSATQDLIRIQGGEKLELQQKLINNKMLIDSHGQLINSQQRLKEMQDEINSKSYDATEDGVKKKKEDIEALKELQNQVNKYTTLVNSEIPKNTKSWDDLNSSLKEVNDSMNKIYQDTVSDLRDKIIEGLKADIEKEQEKEENNAKKIYDKKLKNKDKEIQQLQDELNSLDDSKADNEKKLAKLIAERNAWSKDDSVFAKGKIKNLDEQIADLQKTLKKEDLQSQIDALNEEKNKIKDTYDEEVEATKDKYEEMLDEHEIYNRANKLLQDKNINEIQRLMKLKDESFKDIGLAWGENLCTPIQEQINQTLTAIDNLKNKTVGNNTNSDTSGEKSNSSSKNYAWVDEGAYTQVFTDSTGTESKGSLWQNGYGSADKLVQGTDRQNGFYEMFDSNGKSIGWVDADKIRKWYDDIAQYDTGGDVNIKGNEEKLAFVGKGEKVLNPTDSNTLNELGKFVKSNALQGIFDLANSIKVSEIPVIPNNISIPTSTYSGMDFRNVTNNSNTNNNSNVQSVVWNNNIDIVNNTREDSQLNEKAFERMFKKQSNRF